MAVLSVLQGPNRGAWFSLRPSDGPWRLGREVSSEVCLLDDRSSRSHAEIRFRDGAFWLEDLKSRNGTTLNGLPLRQPAPLQGGDRIRVGDTVLAFRAGPGASPLPGRATTVTLGPEAGPVPPPDARVLRALASLAPPEVEGLAASGEADELTGDELAKLLAECVRATGADAARVVQPDGAGSGERVVASAVREELDPGAPASAARGASHGGATLSIDLAGPRLQLVIRRPQDAIAWRAVAATLAPRLAPRPGADLEIELEAGAFAPSPSGALPGAAPTSSGPFVAESEGMRRLLSDLGRIARSEASVLIQGESGVGKERIARLVHRASPRARRAFVAVNAAALPKGLEESELFGHERGAFTGAIARRKGLFELADRGTLFFDEVAELGLETQAKLLRVLETGELRRVGGEETVRTDVRVLAATNRNLKERVREGRFRSDLYFRLAVVELRVPPLRERAADLVPLATELLGELAAASGGRPPALEEAALARLRAHSWPGNVRELRNVLERALLLGDGRRVRATDLPPEVRDAAARAAAEGGPDGATARPRSFPTLREIERRHLVAALEHTGWVKKHAASALGIDRKTLHTRMRAMGITEERDGSAGGGR